MGLGYKLLENATLVSLAREGGNLDFRNNKNIWCSFHHFLGYQFMLPINLDLQPFSCIFLIKIYTSFPLPYFPYLISPISLIYCI